MTLFIKLKPRWHSPKAGHGRFQDAKTTTGFSALHFACALGNLSATDSLLRLRADINARTSHEVSALHLATENGHLMIVTWRNVMWWEFSLSKGGGCIVFSYIFFLYGVVQGECPSYYCWIAEIWFHSHSWSWRRENWWSTWCKELTKRDCEILLEESC